MMLAHKHIQNPTLRWMKENLFHSWHATLLTLGILWFCYRLLVPTFVFVFQEANWKVVIDNLHLFAVGSYPTDQVWRVLLIVVLLSGLIGATVATQTTMKAFSWAMFGFFIVCAVWIAIENKDQNIEGPNAANPYFLIAGLTMYLIGYFLQKRTSFLKVKILLVGWSLYFFFSLGLLNGITGSHMLPKVDSNLWGGLLLTLLVAVVGIIASFPLGILLALGRRSKLPIVKLFCIGLIEIIRGVPLIAILFMAQILIPLFLPSTLVLSNLLRVMIAVTFFAAAYMAEYIRGGLQAVPLGQLEAAHALGLDSFHTNLFIILPQAIRAVIPALVGECIALFKDTSLVAIVGLLDLTGAAKAAIGQADFIGLETEVFLAIAVVYWAGCFLMSKYSRHLENEFGVGVR